jgi:hypothetical protein
MLDSAGHKILRFTNKGNIKMYVIFMDVNVRSLIDKRQRNPMCHCRGILFHLKNLSG